MKLLLVLTYIILLVTCGTGMKYRTVNTKMEKSPGLDKDGKVYFLLEYVLSQPGRTIVPMYMYEPGDVYLDEVVLYSFSPSDGSLAPLCRLQPLSTHQGRGDIGSARWACEDGTIYVSYNGGWTKESGWIQEIFSYRDGSCSRVEGDEKGEIARRCLSDGGKKAPGAVDLKEIRFHTDHIPFDKWVLASPLEFCRLSLSELKKAIVEGIGDRLFRELAFERLKREYGPNEMLGMVESLARDQQSASSYEKARDYHHYQVWTIRLRLEAKYGARGEGGQGGFCGSLYRNENAAAKELLRSIDDVNISDDGGATPLMVAAFADNAEMTRLLLENSARIDDTDNAGCTALMYAIIGNACQTMEILLESGADTEIVSAGNMNAWGFAAVTGLRARYLARTQGE